MSTKNNKNLASQALLEMEQITSAIKEESKKSIEVLLAEAVKDALREGCDEEEEKDEYEVIDSEEKDADDNVDDSQESEGDEDATEDSEEASPYAEEPEADEETGEETAEVETQEASSDDEGDEWSEFSKYQVGDNAYDLTGENDYENVVKVYKLLTGDDQVVVKQDGNKIQLKDDSVGTEYVIDLGDEDGEDIEVEVGEDDVDSIQEAILGPDDPDFWPSILPRKYREDMTPEELKTVRRLSNNIKKDDDIAGFSDEYRPKGHSYASSKEVRSLENDDWANIDREEMYESKNKKNNIKENKTRKPMKESKEVLFEVDLGYTDNYQDKDPIAGLSNNEPSKSGKSWHKGVPTGTQKPWAGNAKSKSEPFATTISEEEMPVEEGTNVAGAVQQRTSSKSHAPANRENFGPKAKRHVSTGANYQEIVAENKKLKAENKELKEAILAIRKNLSEAYVTNANLGKITKLFLENTTTQAEKIDIVNRFSNEAKTIESSKALYESIKRELNKPVGSQMTINESMTTANGSTINEEKAYKSNDVLKTIDFMNRVLKY